jgi:hypothetical protein
MRELHVKSGFLGSSWRVHQHSEFMLSALPADDLRGRGGN